MKKYFTKEVEQLFSAILSLESIDECKMFFEDVCTIKEILDISQRLKAAKMLRDGANYSEVCASTGMSTATISRVSKCLEYGSGGYKLVLDRTDDKENDAKGSTI